VLTAAGDLDRDGFEDVLVKTWVDDVRERSVLAISGADGEEMWRMQDEAGRVEIGLAIAPLGDLDSDDVPEILVSRGPLYDGMDGVHHLTMCSGRDGRVLRSRFVNMEGPADGWFTSSIAQIGDLDLDGFPDYAALNFEDFTWHTGAYSGKTGLRLYEVPCESEDPFGSNTTDVSNRVLGSGDVDEDGVPDLVVTVFTYSHVGDPEQGVHVLSGRDGSVLFRKTVASKFPTESNR
jgi:hypothetical protein